MKNKIIESLKKHNMSFAWVMLYFYDQVVMGKYENNKLILTSDSYTEELCYEVHLFNRDKELRGSRDFDLEEFTTPFDGEFHMEEKFFILGNKISEEDFIVLTQYGRKIKLPILINEKMDFKKLRLVVHHLFNENTGYVDGYRLVDIEGER